MDQSEQLHGVLTYCLQFAEEMLAKAGEFYPFGAVVGHDGKVAALGFSDGEEYPSPQELYEFAERSIAHSAASGEILAGGLAVNVRCLVPRSGDTGRF